MNELLERELKTISISELNDLYNTLTSARKKIFSTRVKYEKNIFIDSKISSIALLKRFVTNLSKKNKKDAVNYINEFMVYYDGLTNILNSRIDDIRNSKDNYVLNELYKTNETYFSIIKLLGEDEDYLNRLGFDSLLYTIKTSSKANDINRSFLSIINSLNKMGIIVNTQDFKFITHVNNYITEVFKAIDNGSEKELNAFLKEEMTIYSNFSKYLYLTVLNLLNNLKPRLIKYLNRTIHNKLINVKSDEVDIYNKYFKTRKEYINLLGNDDATILEYFQNNKRKMGLYVENNKKINAIISSISNIKIYSKYTEQERVFYTNNLIELYWDLDEYKFVNDYKYLFDYVENSLNTVFKLNDYRKNKKSLEIIKRRILKTNKFLVKEMEKLNKVLVMDSDLFYKIQEKTQNISRELDELVDTNMELLTDYSFLKFRKNIHETINEKSTIHDVLKVLNNNFEVLKSISRGDISDIYEMEYFHHLSLLDNIYYNHIDSIKYLIEQKYNLYNINISIPDLETKEYEELKDDLSFLIRYLIMLNKKISIDDIKIIISKKN